MEGKYITVLDFEVGKVFQYESPKHLINWNNNEKDDIDNIVWYLTEIQEHNLKNCEWMVHNDNTVYVKGRTV